MKKLKTFIFIGFISTLSLVMVACSDDKKEPEAKKKGDHVWKTQTDTLKSAKEMSKKMQKSLDEQQKKLDQAN